MMSKLRSPYTLAVALLASAATLAGIYTGQQVHADATAATPPAPKVEVLELTPRDVRTWHSFSGRLTPVAAAEIKPRVSGAIEQVLFTDGQLVKQGEPLFIIDPRPHQAELARSQAQLANARARAKLASDELTRAKQLFEAKLVSASIYDTAHTEQQVAEAEVKAAQSALTQAELNVEYAHITAPISGRVGRAEITAGNVVQAGVNAPVLTTIVANDELYAEFNVSEQTYLSLTRAEPEVRNMPVDLSLSLADSPIYHGHMYAFDNRLNSDSGTIRARAIFTNSDGLLTPGMFADVRLGSAATQASLLVPELAIGTNQDKKFVYVVDANNTVQYREVALGGHVERARIVTEGLTAGERIAINSLAHLRPNTVVDPVPTESSNQVASH